MSYNNRNIGQGEYWSFDDDQGTPYTDRPSYSGYETSRTPQSDTDSGSGKEGGNSAAQQMIGQGISDTGEIFATVGMGLLQKKDNERARAEARRISDLQRSDDLEQQQIENTFRSRSHRQDERAFETRVRKDKFDIKFQKWMEAFKQEVNRDMARFDAVSRLKDKLRKSRVRDDAERTMFR